MDSGEDGLTPHHHDPVTLDDANRGPDEVIELGSVYARMAARTWSRSSASSAPAKGEFWG